LEKTHLARNLLISKMCEICIVNPKFGRKCIVSGYDGKQLVSFDDKIPSFTMNDAYKYHIGQRKFNSTDSDDESYSDDDTDSVS